MQQHLLFICHFKQQIFTGTISLQNFYFIEQLTLLQLMAINKWNLTIQYF